MSFFKKLFTAFRGITTEAGEVIIDTQTIRILEQEVRDAKKYLDEAKENLAKVIAEQMGIDREIKRLSKSIEEYEGYAIQALDKSNNKLAEEIAEKIAVLENELNAQQNVLESYNFNVTTLKQHIKETEHKIKSIEREINVVKTTESVQKANVAATKFSGSTSTLQSASESLERIKKKQQQKTDQMKAARELQEQESGGDLPEKLRESGIVQDKVYSHSVLERIKAKHSDSKKDIHL